MPVARPPKGAPWYLLCSHHVHDGGLRAHHKAYGEYRLAQQTEHIRELENHNLACQTPPCSCKAKGLDPNDYLGEFYAKEDVSQWGDKGRNSTSRRRDRKRPTRTHCTNPRQHSGAQPHNVPPDARSSEHGHIPQSRARAPPPQPPAQGPTARQLAEAWSNYKERCHAMCELPKEPNSRRRYLTFSSIPWPVFGTVTQLSDLRPDAIRDFLCPPNSSHHEQRARVKSALLVFHPDKSAARWLSCIHPNDTLLVQDALNILTRHLTSILRSL